MPVLVHCNPMCVCLVFVCEPLTTTDVFVHVLTLPVITLTDFAMNTAVSWWMARALSTDALT